MNPLVCLSFKKFSLFRIKYRIIFNPFYKKSPCDNLNNNLFDICKQAEDMFIRCKRNG